jgi:RNA-directed DNA polymerase
MKRKNNLFQQIASVENLQAADQKARKGKKDQYGIKVHDARRDLNIQNLHRMLLEHTYTTSKYTTFLIYEPKEREIFRLPYFPDRIVHHAVMNVLQSIFISTLTRDTYSCIPGRGIHAASNALKNALRHPSESTFCLKLDIKKFYPSVDHAILKQLLRRKFKDADLLWLLDDIIDSAPGLPIGNYLSQYLANFYLSEFDHWLKEKLKVRHYFRYADDIVILGEDKPYLHSLLDQIRTFLTENLALTIKDNYQVFPVAARGIDFVGYVHFHTHTLMRKTIKQNFARMMAKNRNKASFASYSGWAKHCDSKNLVKKLTHERI